MRFELLICILLAAVGSAVPIDNDNANDQISIEELLNLPNELNGGKGNNIERRDTAPPITHAFHLIDEEGDNDISQSTAEPEVVVDVIDEDRDELMSPNPFTGLFFGSNNINPKPQPRVQSISHVTIHQGDDANQNEGGEQTMEEFAAQGERPDATPVEKQQGHSADVAMSHFLPLATGKYPAQHPGDESVFVVDSNDKKENDEYNRKKEAWTNLVHRLFHLPQRHFNSHLREVLHHYLNSFKRPQTKGPELYHHNPNLQQPTNLNVEQPNYNQIHTGSVPPILKLSNNNHGLQNEVELDQYKMQDQHVVAPVLVTSNICNGNDCNHGHKLNQKLHTRGNQKVGSHNVNEAPSAGPAANFQRNENNVIIEERSKVPEGIENYSVDESDESVKKFVAANDEDDEVDDERDDDESDEDNKDGEEDSGYERRRVVISDPSYYGPPPASSSMMIDPMQLAMFENEVISQLRKVSQRIQSPENARFHHSSANQPIRREHEAIILSEVDPEQEVEIEEEESPLVDEGSNNLERGFQFAERETQPLFYLLNHKLINKLDSDKKPLQRLFKQAVMGRSERNYHQNLGRMDSIARDIINSIDGSSHASHDRNENETANGESNKEDISQKNSNQNETKEYWMDMSLDNQALDGNLLQRNNSMDTLGAENNQTAGPCNQSKSYGDIETVEVNGITNTSDSSNTSSSNIMPNYETGNSEETNNVQARFDCSQESKGEDSSGSMKNNEKVTTVTNSNDNKNDTSNNNSNNNNNEIENHNNNNNNNIFENSYTNNNDLSNNDSNNATMETPEALPLQDNNISSSNTSSNPSDTITPSTIPMAAPQGTDKQWGNILSEATHFEARGNSTRLALSANKGQLAAQQQIRYGSSDPNSAPIQPKKLLWNQGSASQNNQETVSHMLSENIENNENSSSVSQQQQQQQLQPHQFFYPSNIVLPSSEYENLYKQRAHSKLAGGSVREIKYPFQENIKSAKRSKPKHKKISSSSKKKLQKNLDRKKKIKAESQAVNKSRSKLAIHQRKVNPINNAMKSFVTKRRSYISRGNQATKPEQNYVINNGMMPLDWKRLV